MVNALDITSGQEYLARRIIPGGTFDQLLKFPPYLEIETVNACNARCPMCTIADWERGYQPMTDKLYGKIATEVIEHAGDIKRVSLYRDGEPLIDKKLPARIAMLKDGGVQNLCISTNVSLLNETWSAGHHTVTWHGKDDSGRRVAAGVYLIEMVTAETQIVHKALYLK